MFHFAVAASSIRSSTASLTISRDRTPMGSVMLARETCPSADRTPPECASLRRSAELPLPTCNPDPDSGGNPAFRRKPGRAHRSVSGQFQLHQHAVDLEGLGGDVFDEEDGARGSNLVQRAERCGQHGEASAVEDSLGFACDQRLRARALAMLHSSTQAPPSAFCHEFKSTPSEGQNPLPPSDRER